MTMKSTGLKINIQEIKKMVSQMPKTINESLNFEEAPDFDAEVPAQEEMPAEEPINNEPAAEPAEEPVAEPKDNEPQEEGGMDVMAFVDDIRKKSLKGMAALADNPDDEKYQLLKKIWQICDKKPDQQSVFNNPNVQMQQQR